jgi:hypothetical protein
MSTKNLPGDKAQLVLMADITAISEPTLKK